MTNWYDSYTVCHLPACKDWMGAEYPERFGLTLTLRGPMLGDKPIKVDGGEFATRDAAHEAGRKAVTGGAA